jgi:hypothetical protein
LAAKLAGSMQDSPVSPQKELLPFWQSPSTPHSAPLSVQAPALQVGPQMSCGSRVTPQRQPAGQSVSCAQSWWVQYALESQSPSHPWHTMGVHSLGAQSR